MERDGCCCKTTFWLANEKIVGFSSLLLLVYLLQKLQTSLKHGAGRPELEKSSKKFGKSFGVGNLIAKSK